MENWIYIYIQPLLNEAAENIWFISKETCHLLMFNHHYIEILAGAMHSVLKRILYKSIHNLYDWELLLKYIHSMYVFLKKCLQHMHIFIADLNFRFYPWNIHFQRSNCSLWCTSLSLTIYFQHLCRVHCELLPEWVNRNGSLYKLKPMESHWDHFSVMLLYLGDITYLWRYKVDRNSIL